MSLPPWQRAAPLSGVQRVAIGRAMARKPKVLLFDEALSNHDAARRVQIIMEAPDAKWQAYRDLHVMAAAVRLAGLS